MLATEFVTAYADELTPEQIHPGTYSQGIEEAQDWSYRFGRLLHASLRGDPTDRMMSDLSSYPAWMAREKNSLGGRVSQEGSEDSAHRFSEVNFHYLNWALLPMWRALVEGGWQSPQQRAEAFKVMGKSLAIDGLARYMLRKSFVNQAGSEKLFTERNKPFAEAFNGALQEFDAGTVLLDVVQKHPDLLLLAAPLQFERGVSSECNVDLLVVNFAGKRAVGAQVKSNVRSETVERYDPERVVLIDGNVDFDNVLSIRTRKGSSQERVVGCPDYSRSDAFWTCQLQAREWAAKNA